MRKTILFIALLIASLPLGAQAADLFANSKITTVTVFTDRALVTREATLSIAPGTHKLIIKELPGGLDNESVRGWGKGVAKVKLLGINVASQELAQATDEEIRKLEEKLDSINAEIEAIKQEKSVLEVERNYLASLSASFVSYFNRGVITGESTGARLSTVEAIIIRRSNAIADRKIALDAQLRLLERDKAATQEKLDKLRHPGETSNKTLTVDVECVSAGTFTLSFSYIMKNAGWAPVYDIRADSNTGKIEIVSKANVWQQVGEDWSQVELLLSTASPQVGGAMPEPTPLELDFTSYQTGKKKNGRGMTGGMYKMAEAAPEPQPGSSMTSATAEVITGETAVEYKIRSLRTVKSDGKPNLVPIGSDTFDGTIGYMTIPSENLYAYMQAKVKNNSEKAFLPGEAAIFLAGKFVGKAKLPRWAPGEEIEMPLGIDEAVSIKRDLVNKKTDSSFGKTTVTYQWKIEIVNNVKQEIKLKLFEPIPQSRNSDIEVKITLIEPEPTKIEEGGKARWDFTLVPGAKQIVKIEYRVKYPSNERIENLP